MLKGDDDDLFHHGRSTKSGMTAPHARVGPPGWPRRTIGGELVQPVRHPVSRAEPSDKSRDMIATLPATCRTFDPQHLELADQVAERSIEWHLTGLVNGLLFALGLQRPLALNSRSQTKA
jgi:hypothetical protein